MAALHCTSEHRNLTATFGTVTLSDLRSASTVVKARLRATSP